MLNKKIEYFVTLAECLSFTQAAAAHSVSQTAISQYIASLEAKLQVQPQRPCCLPHRCGEVFLRTGHLHAPV